MKLTAWFQEVLKDPSTAVDGDPSKTGYGYRLGNKKIGSPLSFKRHFLFEC